MEICLGNCSHDTLTKIYLQFLYSPVLKTFFFFFSLRLGIPGPQTEHQLLKLDEQGLTNTYKVGVLYCRAGQSTEEQMYNNEQAGPALNEFLETLGQRVRLKGFKHYRAGLDNKSIYLL